MLNQNNAERLVKVLNLLSSPYDGERAAAGAAATRILKDLGLSWGEVIRAPAPSIVPGEGRPPGAPAWRNGDATDYRRMARFCWNHRWGLSARDQQFIQSMLALRGEPSEAQQRWLCSLYSRVFRMTRGRV